MSAIFRLSLDVTCDCSEVKFAQDEVAPNLHYSRFKDTEEREEIKRWLSRSLGGFVLRYHQVHQERER